MAPPERYPDKPWRSGHAVQEFIREVQRALVPIERWQHPYILPEPKPPFLVFELLDRQPCSKDVPGSRIFRPFVYHPDQWTEKDYNLIAKNIDSSKESNRPALRDRLKNIDPRKPDFDPLIQEYEDRKIADNFMASGSIWQAWRQGRFLESHATAVKQGLFLQFTASELKSKEPNYLIQTLDKCLGVERDSIYDGSDDPSGPLYDLIEYSLIHQVDRTLSSDENWLLVHYPLLVEGIWFLGMAYFLAPEPAETENPIFRPDDYWTCSFDLAKQYSILKRSLLRSRVLENTCVEWRAPVQDVFRIVAQHYFTCFDVAEAASGYRDPCVQAHGVSLCLPRWVKDDDHRTHWEEFLLSQLEELYMNVEHVWNMFKGQRSEEEEVTSRQMLLDVSHNIDTDLYRVLDDLENARRCIEGADLPHALESAILYLDGGKVAIEGITTTMETILAITKNSFNAGSLPIVPLSFPECLVEDLELFTRHSNLLRLSGPDADEIRTFLADHKHRVSLWIVCDKPFTFWTYQIFRKGLQEVIRNALRYIRPANESAPIRVILKKMNDSVSLSVSNNKAADKETVRTTNGPSERPKGGQFGIELYKRIFKTCGAKWNMEVKDGWTRLTITLTEVNHEPAVANNPG